MSSAGARLVRGSSVAVLVSSGKPRVPQVRPGDDIDTIRSAIRDAGLKPVDSGERASTAPKGTLAELDPAPGTVLPMDASVQVYRSKGSTPVKLPDVRATSPDQARTRLDRVGISVRDNRSAFDPKVEAGRVAGTDPAAGTTVLSGTSVTLLVSNAVRVPDVGGKTVAAARSELEGLGLHVSLSNIFTGNDRGMIRGQNPIAGANVEPGSNVNLVVLPF